MWQTLATVAMTALVTTIVGFLWNYVVNHTKRAVKKKQLKDKTILSETINECLEPFNRRFDAVETDIYLIKKGLQHELKIELRERYNYWIQRKYAPSSAREDLENIYQSYHALGKNGVMDDLRDRFRQLPLEKPPKGSKNGSKQK